MQTGFRLLVHLRSSQKVLHTRFSTIKSQKGTHQEDLFRKRTLEGWVTALYLNLIIFLALYQRNT